jgi:hypothetical protein
VSDDELVLELNAAADHWRKRALAAEAKLREQALGSLEQNTDMHEALDRAEAIEAERDWFKELLAEAVDDIEHWGSYAGEYFQEKWNLAGDLAKYRAALDSTEGPEQ